MLYVYVDVVYGYVGWVSGICDVDCVELCGEIV